MFDALLSWSARSIETVLRGVSFCTTLIIAPLQILLLGICWVSQALFHRCPHNTRWKNPFLWARWATEHETFRWKRCRVCGGVYSRPAA